MLSRMTFEQVHFWWGVTLIIQAIVAAVMCFCVVMMFVEHWRESTVGGKLAGKLVNLK